MLYFNRIALTLFFIQMFYIQRVDAQSKDPVTLLKTELQCKDFFRLRENYETSVKHLKIKDQLYFKAFITNAFNQCGKSIVCIQTLLLNYCNQINLHDKVGLMILQIDNFAKTYKYKLAAKTYKDLIKKYEKKIDSAKLFDLKNENIIWTSLAKIPPMHLSSHKNVEIAWKKDAADLINIPVKIDGKIIDFIFDTGANLSTISDSYAKKLNLKRINVFFSLGSSTSISTKASLAVASNLYIGSLHFKNVVFIVLPDYQLSFPQINYRIDGIIGFPVIKEMGEVTISQSETITVPKKEGVSKLRNLALDGLQLIIQLHTKNDALPFSFDTGAKETQLSKLYFDRFKDEILLNAKQDTIALGGAGGVAKFPTYRLANFEFYLNKKISLPNVNVLTTQINKNENYYYGNIGQDVIKKFNSMTINFINMYLDLK